LLAEHHNDLLPAIDAVQLDLPARHEAAGVKNPLPFRRHFGG